MCIKRGGKQLWRKEKKKKEWPRITPEKGVWSSEEPIYLMLGRVEPAARPKIYRVRKQQSEPQESWTTF